MDVLKNSYSFYQENNQISCLFADHLDRPHGIFEPRDKISNPSKSVAPENTEKNMKQKFKLNDQKYNLKSRKDRNELDKELKTYDPDCQCCQAWKLADESNSAKIVTPVQKRRKRKMWWP